MYLKKKMIRKCISYLYLLCPLAKNLLVCYWVCDTSILKLNLLNTLAQGLTITQSVVIVNMYLVSFADFLANGLHTLIIVYSNNSISAITGFQIEIKS